MSWVSEKAESRPYMYLTYDQCSRDPDHFFYKTQREETDFTGQDRRHINIDTVVTPLHVPPLPFCMEVGRTGKFFSKDLQVVHKFSDARGARQSRLGEKVLEEREHQL